MVQYMAAADTRFGSGTTAKGRKSASSGSFGSQALADGLSGLRNLLRREDGPQHMQPPRVRSGHPSKEGSERSGAAPGQRAASGVHSPSTEGASPGFDPRCLIPFKSMQPSPTAAGGGLRNLLGGRQPEDRIPTKKIMGPNLDSHKKYMRYLSEWLEQVNHHPSWFVERVDRRRMELQESIDTSWYVRNQEEWKPPAKKSQRWETLPPLQ